MKEKIKNKIMEKSKKFKKETEKEIEAWVLPTSNGPSWMISENGKSITSISNKNKKNTNKLDKKQVISSRLKWFSMDNPITWLISSLILIILGFIVNKFFFK